MTVLMLLGFGLQDLLRAGLPGRLRRAALPGALLGVGLACLVARWSGTAWLPVVAAGLVGVGAALAWTALRGGSPRVRLLLVGGVVLVALSETAPGVPGPAAMPLPVTLAAAVVALLETGNLVTRDVLVLAGRPSSDRTGPATDEPGLQGGRFIGPMERLLMMLLGLVGAWPVVAALMAAKGIVRFPEIAQDTRAGRRSRASAEEFLVGSLASWSAAAGVGVLVHLAL